MIKYDDKINDIECNLTLNSSDISTDLKELLLDIIRDKTRCYYDYAHANKNSLDDIFGLQIYKDYYRTINLIYKGNDNEFHEVGICNLYKNNENKWQADLYQYFNNKSNVSKYELELTSLFNNNFDIKHDYDYENAMEAISSGDSEWLDEIVGDRDLIEIIG